jgi:hypothetical protein
MIQRRGELLLVGMVKGVCTKRGGRVFYDMLFDILPLFFLHCFFLSVCSQVWNEDFVCLSRFLRGGIEFLLGVQYDTLSWRSLSLDP